MLNNKPMLARVVPFAFYIFVMMIGDIANNSLSASWFYVIRMIGTALLLIYFWPSYTELKLSKKISIHTTFYTLLIGFFVFVLWINLNESWMIVGDTSTASDSAGIYKSMPMVVMHLLGASIIVPIMEELFWRSYLMRWIDRVDFITLSPFTVSFKAIFISSLLFASEHSLWFAGLLAGLIYALLFMRTQNLWYSIFAHAITNLSLGIWVVSMQQWQYW